MLIKSSHPFPIKPSEITPESTYLDRRKFLERLGLTAIGLGVAACGNAAEPPPPAKPEAGAGLAPLKVTKSSSLAGGETQTPFETVTHYNNYYEFGTDKSDPADNAGSLKTRPWSVAVEGECEAPGVLALDDLLKPFALEERIYRHRCVEAWSIVVPWVGIPLADVLKRFNPTSKAKFVSFVTLYDPAQMPLTRRGVLDWPYKEGLRIDEAMHPLAFLSVGMYGKVLPNQNGAPLRLKMPWKYGFKSIKAIVKIRFDEQQPAATWNHMAADEYGFYSNVNPEVDHPRWSQKSERRLGELFKRPTLMFNGYPEVASLYAGMDLRKNF